MKKETLTVKTNVIGTVTYRNADGDLHNPHGLAVIYANGHKEHYINDNLHNENGPAMVCADGSKRYYINGRLHNPNGPAVVKTSGYKEYYINGELHNENGPAIVWTGGDKSYYINGKRLTKSEFKTWQAQQTAPLHNKTATIDGIEYTLTAK